MEQWTEVLRICGVAVLCAVVLCAFGKQFGALGATIRIGGGVLIFGMVAALLGESIDKLRVVLSIGVGTEGFPSETFSLMLKALGIAFVSKFCAGVCRDCGENTLAGGVESAGRIAMISLCLPLLLEILSRASEILDMGI